MVTSREEIRTQQDLTTNKKITQENSKNNRIFKIYRSYWSSFQELSILPLGDINNEAIALFMFRYFNNMLSSPFKNFFCLNKEIHEYNTRSSSTFTKFEHALTTKNTQ